MAYEQFNGPAQRIRKAENTKLLWLAKRYEDQRPTVWAVAVYDTPDTEDGGPSFVSLLALNEDGFSTGICGFSPPFGVKIDGGIQKYHVAQFIEKAYLTGAKSIMLRYPYVSHNQFLEIIDSSVQPSLKEMEDKLAKEANGIDGIIVSPVVGKTLDCPMKFVADSPGEWRTDHPDWFIEEHGPDDSTIWWPIGASILALLNSEAGMVCVLRY